MYPSSLENIIQSFMKLPGIGEKTAVRLAFSLLDFDEETLQFFGESVANLKKQIKYCSRCGSLTDHDLCNICSDKLRDASKLIVVKEPKDIFLFEKMGIFNGYYHVLGGVILPIDDIGPADLAIPSLLNRIKEEPIAEVVLAIGSGIEADTTALYIKKSITDKNVVVTRLASGIPIGADMDYVDALTLETALQNRKEVLDTIS